VADCVVLKRRDRNRFFLVNREKQDAAIRRIEIIGEATAHLTQDDPPSDSRYVLLLGFQASGRWK
jgi:hypothetical protein